MVYRPDAFRSHVNKTKQSSLITVYIEIVSSRFITYLFLDLVLVDVSIKMHNTLQTMIFSDEMIK
jgi:hypothetical protein